MVPGDRAKVIAEGDFTGMRGVVTAVETRELSKGESSVFISVDLDGYGSYTASEEEFKKV